MTPQQAFEVLLTFRSRDVRLTLSDAATALRVSELRGLTWMDIDFHDMAIHVRRAYVWGRFKEPKSKASKATILLHSLVAGFLLAWRDRTPYAKDSHYVFPSLKLKGKKPLSPSILVQKYLRPAAIKAGVIAPDWKGRFGFHNFRHSLATALVVVLRHEDFGTTMQLYAQSDMEAMRDAQGKFIEQLIGDRLHLLTERLQ